MKHVFEQKIYYGDTDAFGVVWHATYLRWLEVGRMELMAKLGYDLERMQKEDIVMTLPDIHIKYKSSAMLNDTIIVETSITNVSNLSATFFQTISDKETGKIRIQAEIQNVAINNAHKLYRKLPETLKQALEKAIE